MFDIATQKEVVVTIMGIHMSSMYEAGKHYDTSLVIKYGAYKNIAGINKKNGTGICLMDKCTNGACQYEGSKSCRKCFKSNEIAVCFDSKSMFQGKVDAKANPNGKYTLLKIGKCKDKYDLYFVRDNETKEEKWYYMGEISYHLEPRNNKFTNFTIKDDEPVPGKVPVEDLTNTWKKIDAIENTLQKMIAKKLVTSGLTMYWDSDSDEESLIRCDSDTATKCIDAYKKLNLNSGLDARIIFDEAVEKLEANGYKTIYVGVEEYYTFYIMYNSFETKERALDIANKEQGSLIDELRASGYDLTEIGKTITDNIYQKMWVESDEYEQAHD